MDQETTLRSTFFGGYRKKDVVAYVNAVIESRDQKVAQLEQQLALLLKRSGAEAGAPKPAADAAGVAPAAKSEETGGEAVRAARLLEESRQAQEIRERMNIPEGVYRVAGNRALIELPAPEGEPLREKEDAEKAAQPRQVIHLADRRASASAQTERVVEGTAALKEAADAADEAQKPQQPEPHTRGGKQPAGETGADGPTRERLREQIDSLIDTTLQAELDAMQRELDAAKAELAHLRKENEALTAKLAYSSELLLQLYHK